VSLVPDGTPVFEGPGLPPVRGGAAGAVVRRPADGDVRTDALGDADGLGLALGDPEPAADADPVASAWPRDEAGAACRPGQAKAATPPATTTTATTAATMASLR